MKHFFQEFQQSSYRITTSSVIGIFSFFPFSFVSIVFIFLPEGLPHTEERGCHCIRRHGIPVDEINDRFKFNICHPDGSACLNYLFQMLLNRRN